MPGFHPRPVEVRRACREIRERGRAWERAGAGAGLRIWGPGTGRERLDRGCLFDVAGWRVSDTGCSVSCCVEAQDHFGEHRHDSAEQASSLLDRFFSCQAYSDADVESGRTFCSRSTGDAIEPRLIFGAEFPRTFCNVERHRRRRTHELVIDPSSSPWHPLQELLHKADEVQCCSI
jgi:hypothetical protein